MIERDFGFRMIRNIWHGKKLCSQKQREIDMYV